MPLRIGLTGGIGSGKSTVATLLAGLGAAIIDTDAIARELTLPGGAAIGSIGTTFGADFIDATGALDRPRMRALAFADPGAKRRLEAILHPLIGAETERRAAAAHEPVHVFDVPLLAESKTWRMRVHKVLVVDCSATTQRARVRARSGWDAATIDGVIASQAPREKRRVIADAVIFNDGISLDALAAQVRALWSRWTVTA